MSIRNPLCLENVTKIVENAESLLKTAEEISNSRHAAHSAFQCLEECAKCLMIISNSFSKKQLKKHYNKILLFGIFRYLRGKLSCVYSIKYTWDQGLLGGTKEDRDRILEHFLGESGMKGLDSLEKVVKEFLNYKKKNGISKKLLSKVGEIRTNSVYVDVDSDKKKVLLPQDRVSEDNILAVVEDAKFAVGFLKMSLNNKFSWDELFNICWKMYRNLEKK